MAKIHHGQILKQVFKGFTLGPPNDLTETLDSNQKLFADDTSLFSTGNNVT